MLNLSLYIKLKAIWILILGIFCFQISISQDTNQPSDSLQLQKKLIKSSGKDSIRILNLLAEEFLTYDVSKSISYSNIALTGAIKLKIEDEEYNALKNLANGYYELYLHDSALFFYQRLLGLDYTKRDDSLMSNTFLSIGLLYNNTGDFKKAKETFQKAIELDKGLNNQVGLSVGYSFLANACHSSGDFQSALIYQNMALKIENELANKQRRADILNSLGIIYFDLGNYELAINNYTESLKLVEKLNNLEGIASALNNIGIVYWEWGNLEKALEYYQKSLNIEKKLNNIKGTAASYNNIGIIYSEWDQDDIAIDYYNKSLDIYIKHHDLQGIADAKNNIGESLFEIGQHKKSLEYLEESLNLEKQLNNLAGMAQSYHTIGMVHFRLRNLNEALSNNDKSYQIADSLKISSLLLLNYELYYLIYFERNNKPMARKYFALYSNQKDTLFNDKFLTNLANVQKVNEIERSNRERELMLEDNKEKEREMRTQRNYLIIIFFLMLIFGVIVYFDIKSKIRANKNLKSINNEITGQKEQLALTIDKLVKSETKYKNLVDYSPTGILYIDKKGNILEVNKKILEILGSPSEEATKEINCLEFPPLKQVGLTDDILNCIDSGEVIYKEGKYKSKWGKTVFIRYFITPVKNRRGTTTSIILNVEDITPSKKAEKSKLESEQKYRMLVENSLQAMLLIQDGKLIFANSRVEELTQHTFIELKAKRKMWVKAIIHPDDYKVARDNIKNALSGVTTPFKTEYRYIRKDGKVRWIESLGSVVDYDEKPAILVVAIDITSRKEAESILLESSEKLKSLNATKDKFFSIIAHDLKNPFSTIMGSSNLLFDAYNEFDEDQRKTFIKNIYEASESTFKLLQNLLEWSRTQTGTIEYNPESISLSKLVNENIKMFKSNLENKKIAIESTVKPNTKIYADKYMINTVIRNLLSNAIKFTNINGKIELSASNTNNKVELCFADDGIGIKKENLNRLFRIDDQLKTSGTNNEEGSGLGLIICKELVEKNNGQIWAESEYGKGSKFKFSLPVNKASVAK